MKASIGILGKTFTHAYLQFQKSQKANFSYMYSTFDIFCISQARGTPSPPKKGADRISTFFQTWGAKLSTPSQGFF